uniref:hypothetical protein n=1 Tax=Bosea sp. (in: a-proteobacteria) TaxID=1871050 RepID=UPI0025BA053C
MRTGGKGTGGKGTGAGPRRGGRPPAAGAPRGPGAKAKRPSHDARRSAQASARARPEREEAEVNTTP